MCKVCPECDSKTINDERQFCIKCGTEMVPMPTCNWCGDEFWPHMKYCGGCGRMRDDALNTSPPKRSLWEKLSGRKTSLAQQ